MTKFDNAHRSAAEAIASPVLGSRTLRSTYAEAFKLAGQPARDVHGRDCWYTTPTGYAGGQDHFSPAGIWHVAISHDKAANEESIAATRAAQAHLLA